MSTASGVGDNIWTDAGTRRAHCPVDDWGFDPRYTDGVCPLCGWRPPGAPVRAPRYGQIDWFWPLVAVLVVVSTVMGVLVLVAYSR